MKQYTFIKSLVLLNLMLVSLYAMGGTERSYSVSDLARESEFIVRGKVIRIETYQNPDGHRFSNIYFHINSSYKGKIIEGQNIVLMVAGGKVGDSKVFTLFDPQFEENQESVLFLSRYLPPNQIKYRFYVTGLAQGKFNIIHENGREFLQRDEYVRDPLKVKKGNIVNEISNSKKMLLEDFINEAKNYID